jgi:hypothetical protein
MVILFPCGPLRSGGIADKDVTHCTGDSWLLALTSAILILAFDDGGVNESGSARNDMVVTTRSL